MRYAVLTGAVAMLVAAILPVSPAQAVPGCCKQRQSVLGTWVATRLGFADCERLNKRRDGDDVFFPEGRIWWDTYC